MGGRRVPPDEVVHDAIHASAWSSAPAASFPSMYRPIRELCCLGTWLLIDSEERRPPRETNPDDEKQEAADKTGFGNRSAHVCVAGPRPFHTPLCIDGTVICLW